MTKQEIVSDISAKTGIEKTTTMAVVEGFMGCVKQALEDGENVYLRGFGTFQLKQRAEKTARNITKNTTIISPAHKVPAFKASPEFRRVVLTDKK